MTGSGRPLRFITMALGLWVGLRVFLLWPTLDSPRAVLQAIAPIPVAAAAAPIAPSTSPPGVIVQLVPPRIRRTAPTGMAPVPIPAITVTQGDPDRVALALLGMVRFADPPADDEPDIVPGLPQPLASKPGQSRWSGSFWLVARPDGGPSSGLLGGQLGGSQAGIRIAYALDEARRWAIAGRLVTPLGSGMREAAIGIEWQPTKAPVRVVAEQRIALNQGKSGPALGVVGGFGPTRVGHGVTLEGYGQAGAIARDRIEPYADGALHAVHPLGELGAVKFDLGAGAWGAAQRGVSRLDIGPTLGARLPLGKQPVRLALDWRERVAGNARPNSGVALTLGADF